MVVRDLSPAWRAPEFGAAARTTPSRRRCGGRVTFDAPGPIPAMSVTKSIVSLAVGLLGDGTPNCLSFHQELVNHVGEVNGRFFINNASIAGAALYLIQIMSWDTHELFWCI